MPIIEPIIRPPAEAGSFLLQVTVGCSVNRCTFCGAYRGKPFKVLDYNDISTDIEEGAQQYPDTRRIFLLDGDALVVPNKELIPVLEKLNQAFLKLARISGYANGCNISKRSSEELKELFENKLRLIYIGLESGSQEILNRCRKASGTGEMIEAVQKAADAGIKSSVIVLLGLGGRKYSREHVRDTITVLNKMQPRYLSFLSVMLIPGTLLYQQVREGKFEELKPQELLNEAHDIIQGLELKKTIFRSNHASNYLPLEGRFPQDKEKLLAIHELALAGRIDLKPEFLRGL